MEAKPPYLLGLDVGTSGCKVLLIDAAGTVVAEETRPYGVSMPRPLWSEQKPEDWWQAASAGIGIVLHATGIDPGQIAGVGLTGQMHGLVLLDTNGQALRPAILWNDQRTAEQCAEITRRVGSQRVLELTGNPILTGFTAPKLLWVQQHEPEVYAKIAHILLPKDYVRYCLTGEFFSEVSDASGTSLFDVGRRQWSDEMLAALKLPQEWLPKVTESPVASANVSPAGAKKTGLIAGTPVVGGGGDQAAQAVGTGIVTPGPVSVTLGTSGVVFAASDIYRVEPHGRLHAFCHAVPGKWHLMGVMLSAGGSFDWWQSLGKSVLTFDEALAAAAEKPAGSEGLLFLPYLTGERTPHADPLARGTFVGLTARHDAHHMTRAVLEGVSFGLRDSLELMRDLGLKFDHVRASGGGAKSPLWRQILADIFKTPIATVNVTQGAAFGAALLAGAGTGVYPDVISACAQVVRTTDRTSASADSHVYDAWYPRYRALYPTLAGEFHQIAKLVEELS